MPVIQHGGLFPPMIHGSLFNPDPNGWIDVYISDLFVTRITRDHDLIMHPVAGQSFRIESYRPSATGCWTMWDLGTYSGMRTRDPMGRIELYTYNDCHGRYSEMFTYDFGGLGISDTDYYSVGTMTWWRNNEVLAVLPRDDNVPQVLHTPWGSTIYAARGGLSIQNHRAEDQVSYRLEITYTIHSISGDVEYIGSESAGVEACAADYDCTGGVDGLDIEHFFNDWMSGLPRADMNGDGGIDGADIADFFFMWERGC